MFAHAGMWAEGQSSCAGEAGGDYFKNLSFRLEDPNSPECVQPNCGTHCFLTEGTGGAGSVLDPAQALRWDRYTGLRTLCFVALMSETSKLVWSV